MEHIHEYKFNNMEDQGAHYMSTSSTIWKTNDMQSNIKIKEILITRHGTTVVTC